MGKKIIRQYMWLTSIDHLFMGLHTAIYVTYLLSNGLDLLQVNLVNVAFMVSVFILEIPTGAIADLFGRKVSFVSSSVVMALGFIWYGITDNFVGFVIAEITIALAVTLTSGAFRAWLVDSLQYHSWPGELSDVFRLEGRCRNVATLLGGLIGAYIGAVSLSLPMIITGIGFLGLAFLAAVIVREDYFTPKKLSEVKVWWNLKEIATTSVSYGLKHKIVFMVITATTVFNLGFPAFNMYWQPQFSEYLSNTEYLGYVWVFVVLTAMIGNELVRFFTKKFPRQKIGFVVIGLVVGLFMVVAAMSNTLSILVLGFMGHEMMRGLIRPYVDTTIQESIPSKTRATVDSFVHMIATGASGIGLVMSGLIAKYYSIDTAWLISGLIIILAMPAVMFFNGKKVTRL
ncbi:MAG: MFS transporter [Candidatus Komeilibacteria bacterium]